MATIATLNVALKTNTKKFSRGLKRAKRQLKNFTSNVFNAKNAVIGFGSALVAGSIANYLKGIADAVDKQAKFSDSIGISFQKFQQLSLVANEAGVSTEQFSNALARLSRGLGESLTTGVGTASDALKELGLTAESLTQLSPTEQFLKVGEALRGIKEKSVQTSVAFDLFGRQGIAITKIFSQTTDEIRKTMEASQELGLNLTRIDAAKIEQANDMIGRLGKSFDIVGQLLVAEIAPIITGVLKRFLEWRKTIDVQALVSQGMQGMVDILIKIKKAINDVSSTFKFLFQLMLTPIQLLISSLTEVAGILTGLVGLVSFNDDIKDASTNILRFADSLGKIAIDDLAKQGKDIFNQLANTENAGNKIKDFFAQLKTDAQKSAEVAVKNINKINSGIVDGIGKAKQKITDNLKREIDRLKKFADNVKKDTRTPLLKLELFTEDIRKSIKAKLLSPERGQQAIEKKRKELFPDKKDARLGQLKDFVNNLKENAKTPLERLNDFAKTLKESLKKGLITAEFGRKEILKRQKELFPEKPKQEIATKNRGFFKSVDLSRISPTALASSGDIIQEKQLTVQKVISKGIAKLVNKDNVAILGA